MRLPRNGFARALLMLVALPAAGGALVGLGLAVGFDGGDSATGRTSNPTSSPVRLKPIPIPARACPYLKAVHDTSVPVGNASWKFVVGNEAERLSAANGLAGKLASFDLALRVAATQVPGEVSVELTQVALNVEHGQELLRSTPNSQTFAKRALDPLVAGVDQLQDASDLVGDTCGFRLASILTP